MLGKPGLDGTVYSGTEIETGEPVAVKVLAPRRTKLDWIHASNEGQLLTELMADRGAAEAAGVVVPIAVEQAPDTYRRAGMVAQVMPLFSCGDLMQFTIDAAKAPGPGAICEADAKILIRRLLTATAYLHRHGWAHQDIKLDNMFLGDDGAVLGDLGLVHRADTARILRRPPTRRSSFVNFYGPELYSTAPFCPRAFDVWGIGAVLYAMLTATGVTAAMGTVTRHRSLDGFSSECQAFVDSCLRYDAAERASVADLLAHAWLADEDADDSDDDGRDDDGGVVDGGLDTVASRGSSGSSSGSGGSSHGGPHQAPTGSPAGEGRALSGAGGAEGSEPLAGVLIPQESDGSSSSSSAETGEGGFGATSLAAQAGHFTAHITAPHVPAKLCNNFGQAQ